MSRMALLIPPYPETPTRVLDLGPDDTSAYDVIKGALDGGWLEQMPWPLPVPGYAFADEEGQIKRLPPNPRAMMLFGRPLVGPVVIIGSKGPMSPEMQGIDAPLQALLGDLGCWPVAS